MVRCKVKGKDQLSHSRVTVVPTEEIEIKGVDDSSGFLDSDDGSGRIADTICRFANGRFEELSVVSESVFGSGEINVIGEGGQGLDGGCSAHSFEVDLGDDLGEMGGNV